MTEAKVEAGDRALARKCVEAVLLDTLGEACLNELDEPLIDEVAEMIQSAMNAQEREMARTLNNLKCEVVGWLGLARPMLVQELSITNVRVMEHHVAEAERLLAERGGTQ